MRWLLPAVALAGIAAGAGAMWAAAGAPAPTERARIERVVREYMLAHPEIIPEAMGLLQSREQGQAVAKAGDAITRPYHGAWMGNPQGDVVLVEYYDYNCGYCRASLPVIAKLIARDPKLKVVFRELPVLAESSRDAARASLAAARANRFKLFHDALYAGGRVTPASIAAAAQSAGVTLPATDESADAEIAGNLRAASDLGITGTPSWVVGDQVLIGAQPLDQLEAAIAQARRTG
ncbi:MAG TPA: DsbA family protein [Sphingomonas sp.]|jgi:protein-disulfide isomerase|uniref:DsbA family protein n=1 Tax=Sphingomonas sp. TaxID=28214 RepID=UPI002EDABBE3